MRNINSPNNPVILFIPEAGIYPFMRGLAVLGDTVIKNGGEVMVTHCTGQMLRSPLMVLKKMPANAPPEQRAKISKKNTEVLKNVLKKYKFSSINISDLIDNELIEEIERLVAQKNDDLESINYRGFPVGKIAQYDFILETKLPYSFKLSKEHKTLYSIYIKNTALAIAITDRICQKYKPSLFITFNEYAQCQGVRFSAQNHNIARMALTYPVHFNVDASRFSIWKFTYDYWRYNHCQKWNNEKNTPIIPEHVKACWNDSIFRMYKSASHIFSSKKQNNPEIIFEKLKLKTNKKTIVVYTSSQEERKSVETAMEIWNENNYVTDAFANHTEWLSMLKDYANKHNDIQIVVRIHPREGKRQYGFDSQHLKELKTIFTQNTTNFMIVWPDDPISSYDLMELADVCLVSWSFMGQEAMRLGIPVLSYTGNMFYPDDDFIQVATTKEEYKRKLDTIINMKYTWNHLIKAVRFYHWRIFLPSLDLGETVPIDFNDNTIWPEAPASMVGVINDILSGKEDLISYNIKKWHNSLTDNSFTEESTAMRLGIRRFLNILFYPPIMPTIINNKKKPPLKLYERVRNKLKRIWRHLFKKKKNVIKKKEDNFIDYCLEYSSDNSQLEKFRQRTEKDKNLRIIIADGHYAILVHNGKLLRRMSPMVINLAKLYEESTCNTI